MSKDYWFIAVRDCVVWVCCLVIVVCAVGGIVNHMDADIEIVADSVEEVVFTEVAEDPFEDEKIEAALIQQGYYREEVPLDYVLQDILYTVCDSNGIPREIGIALIDVESDFNEGAVSPNGCYGLCQLNPKYFPTDLESGDNIRTGIAYLGEQLERYDGDLEAALTAYNAGHDTGKRVYSSKVMTTAEYWREG